MSQEWAICNVLSKISLFDKVNYLFFQLKVILGVVSMVSVELTILVFISLSGINFDFSRPLNEFLMLDFHEYLGDGGIKRGECQLWMANWCTRGPIIVSSP